jgi:DNA-binding transcriptional LysR family regulator
MDHRYHKLIVLVEQGSYSKAAKKLHISQPAMTIAIASLELGLGQKLFTQKKPCVVLSKAGQVVYQTALQLKSHIDAMNNNLDILNKPTKINIGLIDSIAYLMYSDTKNNIILNDIEAMVDNSKKIISDVINNKIDFGLITGQSSNLPSNIKIKKLNHEEFVFVARPSLVPDSNMYEINNWLSFNRASSSYYHFVKQFKELGLKVKPIFYSTSMDLLKQMAIDGKGVALLPKHYVLSDLDNNKLKIINTPKLYRPIWAITNNQNNGQKTNQFISYLNSKLSSI